jgi:hypothetical protein
MAMNLEQRRVAMSRQLVVLAVVWGCLSSGLLWADAWDSETQNDNSAATTENELVNGSDQLHDLASVASAADKDYFRLRQEAYSSYEMVVDSTSGDIGPGNSMLERVDSSGAIVLQPSQPIGAGIGYSVSLRWENTATTAVTDQRILAQSAGCTTNCDSSDVYRIRAYETTYAVPRYNNTSSQTTTLFVQNPTSYAVTLHVYFWDGNGAWVATYTPPVIPAKGLMVLGTQTIAPGTSGSITVSNNARYGDLTGKATALESATGFTFDTLMVPRIK